MNICLATLEFPPITWGGISTYYAGLARLLVEAGHRVIVLTTGNSETADAWTYPGVKVVRLQTTVSNYRERIFSSLSPSIYPFVDEMAAGLAMREWFLTNHDAHAIDVVEMHEYGGACAFLLHEMLPALVVTCHGSIGQILLHEGNTQIGSSAGTLRATFEQFALANADEVACYGIQNLTDWARYLGRLPMFVTAPFIQDTGSNNVKASVESDVSVRGVCVGRLQQWKAPIVLAEALRICKAENGPRIKIEWIGGDTRTAPDGVSMRAYLEENYPDVWNSSFKWIERLEPTQVRQRQVCADFAVVPSLWDTFNFTAIEAMSVSTPVIVSTGTGASYVVKDGVNGLLVPIDDSEALAQAMTILATDERLRRRLGVAGWETVRREFAPEKIVNEHIATYESAIARRAYRKEHPYGSPFLEELLRQSLYVAPLLAADRARILAALPYQWLAEIAWHRALRSGRKLIPSAVKKAIKARSSRLK